MCRFPVGKGSFGRVGHPVWAGRLYSDAAVLGVECMNTWTVGRVGLYWKMIPLVGHATRRRVDGVW